MAYFATKIDQIDWLGKRVQSLESENASLRAEIERLKKPKWKYATWQDLGKAKGWALDLSVYGIELFNLSREMEGQ